MLHLDHEMRPYISMTVPVWLKHESLGAVIQGHCLEVRQSVPKLLQTVSSTGPSTEFAKQYESVTMKRLVK